MEKMGIKQFSDIYRGRRVLVTGHTGFKGSWLVLWLHLLGAKVTGFALSPEGKLNHWDLLGLPISDFRGDIRDSLELLEVIKQTQPEIVFHLAAQPLVRRSYKDPGETWSTNVLGTVNVLEACREASSIRAIVVVTTDKCYENFEWPWGYRENDRLGGYDPYSASKACAELVSGSYRKSFFGYDGAPLLATARAGNVIGGGDWSEDRLIPDLIRSILSRQPIEIRMPNATRPWQHVLESLSGYLLLGKKLLDGDHKFADAWNFGPNVESNFPVLEILERSSIYWGDINWKLLSSDHPHESTLLYLDSSKAQSKLGWKPIWDIEKTLESTIEWYRKWMEDEKILSIAQLTEFVCCAAEVKAVWAEKT